MTIGEQVAARRENLHMTQAELAKRAEVSQSMICQIERGMKIPSLPLTMELARVLECTVDELLPKDGKDERP